jgi:hypothetical protein
VPPSLSTLLSVLFTKRRDGLKVMISVQKVEKKKEKTLAGMLPRLLEYSMRKKNSLHCVNS